MARGSLLRLFPAGPLASRCCEPGQVGNEAAIADCHECRGSGSPLRPWRFPALGGVGGTAAALTGLGDTGH